MLFVCKVLLQIIHWSRGQRLTRLQNQ